MARRSSGGRSARPAPRAAPRPAPVNHAPPPANVQSGGGGGMMGMIGQGMALGAGSELAHRAVSAVMGPRTVQHEVVGNEAAVAAPAPTANSFGGDACNDKSKAFQDCINYYGSDISKCQFYMDMLAECKKNSGASLSM
ncbi:cox19-like chch family protein [Trifolium pratense]|uniref:Cox19-like chch family protein n=1 Tax=Trifolium pratense TaxID=57577 RepID=A0A2K3LEJ0_TRIPR|nr:coiled-coil-helix-coiled-coil-helix domain-containing protein 10, mitochondrial [Trifolium pratense]PNX76940.1 cox19-like chch family protein [Trifolium pratense]